MTRPGPKTLKDVKELRAIAHPVRTRLLTELLARGEATVTALAQAVGEPVNKVSFHLRLLGKYGFVDEAPELARDGRERWWRVAYADGIDWDQLAETHGPIVRTRLLHGMEQALQEIREFYSGAYKQLPEWDHSWFSHDWYLNLRPDEVAEFDREYLDLCFRWRERIARKLEGGDSEDRQTFAVYIYGFPLKTAREPESPRTDV